MTKVNDTPGGEEKKLNADGTPATPAPSGDEVKEPKIGDIVDDGKGKDGEGDGKSKDIIEPKTVGLDKFLDQKKALKAANKRIAELEAGDGIDADDISDEIDAIADEFEVSKPFLKKLEKAMLKKLGITGKAKPADTDDEVSSRLNALETREKAENTTKAFNKEFNRVMDTMPELKEVVNADVIKELTLLPKNRDKTFRQIIEETYGKTVPGRKTIETTRPGGGKEPEGVDFDRAVKDSKYYAEIMANPAMKKQYNDGLEKRLKL